MKTKLLTAWITFSWVGAVALLGLQPASAQLAPSGAVGSLQEDLQRSEGDVFSNSSSVFEIINRIQMINSPSSPTADIDAAAAKFRAQQQQQLQGQSQKPLSPSTPVQVDPVQ